MRIIVTGGAGFIGSHLIEKLLELGYEVICVDNFDDYYDPWAKRQNLAPALESTRFRLVETDIRDIGLMEQLALSREDVVAHLGARPGVRHSIMDPGLYAQVNVLRTINLLEACRRRCVAHFVFASSSSVYGSTTVIPFREEDGPLSPVSPYGASKLAAEQFCFAYHHLYGFPVTCLRFFTVYGPRQRLAVAIHRFTPLIDEGKPIPMYGDGTTRRDYMYVDDIVEGIVQAVVRPDDYQVYNLGNSETIALRDLIAIIERALGKTAIISHLPAEPGDVPITYASIDRAARHLGYAPRIKIGEGVRRFVDLFRAHQAVPLN